MLGSGAQLCWILGVRVGGGSTAGGRERERVFGRPWESNTLLGPLLMGPIKYGLYLVLDPALNHSVHFFVNKSSLRLPRY